ncbi:succinyl-diaminopimelate desuccinylase, partial [Tenacibaculum discolor]
VVDNMVPAQGEVTFKVRYSHGYKSADIKNEIQFALGDLAQNLNIEWERPCESFYTSHQSQNCLLAHVEQAVLSVTGSYPLLSTSGG